MGEGTLHRMGFHKVKGVWVRKTSSSTPSDPTTHHSPSSDHDQDHYTAPPTFPSTSGPSFPTEPSTSAGPSIASPPQQPLEVRISPEQLRKLRDEIVRELRGPLSAPSTDVIPSTAAVSMMIAELRKEMSNIRSLVQGQYWSLRDIKEDTRQMRDSNREEMGSQSQGAERLANALIFKLDTIQENVTQLTEIQSKATSEIITQLGNVSEGISLVMRHTRLSMGATSSTTRRP